MADRKLGIAIHGAGWVAHAHAASWLKNPHAQIVSVSDVDRERARRFAEEFHLDCAVRDDFQQVLDDGQVDVLDITGPSHVHAQQGIAAAQAGKHLLVEKPMAPVDGGKSALRDAVAQAGVKSLAGFVLRWNPAVETIKSLVAAGALGQLFYAEVDYWHRMKPAHHAWDLHSRKQTGGSAMLLGGCHAVDALRWLTGDEAVEVSAMSNNQRGLFEYRRERGRRDPLPQRTDRQDVGPVRLRDAVCVQHRHRRHGRDRARQSPVVEAAAAGADRLDDHPHDPA